VCLSVTSEGDESDCSLPLSLAIVAAVLFIIILIILIVYRCRAVRKFRRKRHSGTYYPNSQ